MNKQIQILLLFLSILMVDKIKSQSVKVDSLENLLKLHNTDDTVKVNLLNKTAYEAYLNDKEKTLQYATQAGELADKLKFLKGKIESLLLIGNVYRPSNPQLGLDYSLKALKIAEEINDKQGVAKSLNLEGNAYNSFGKYAQAHECFQKALKISKDLNDKLLIAKCCTNIGTSYWLESNYTNATEYLQKALAISEQINDKTQIASCLHLLGIISGYQGNYIQALKYQQTSLNICEELNDKFNAASCYISIGIIYYSQNEYQKSLEQYLSALRIAQEMKDKKMIATCYINIGEVYQKQKNQQAFEYFEKALKIAQEISNKSMIVNTLHSIGDLYFSQDNYQNALGYYQNSFKIAKEINNNRNICHLESKIGTIYFKQKNYADALDYSIKSLELARKINLLPVQKEVHLQLSKIYAATNDYKSAYQHHKTYQEINDTIFSEKNIKKITELQSAFKYEKEKQAAELEYQKKEAINKAKQKTITYSLIVGFLLMSSLAFFLFRSYRFKHKTNIILSKQKLEIEELNAEYQAVNEELTQSNEQLFFTKSLVEASEEKLKVIIKNSNDIFVLVNEKGEQYFISDVVASLTGFTASELAGPIENVIYPEDIEIVKEHWNRVISDKTKADCIQYRHKHKEKGYVWLETVAQNFLDNPSINAIVANIRDITERKRTEDALRTSEATKNRLFKLERNRIFDELVSNQKTLAASTLKLIQNSERDANTIKQLAEIEKNTNQEGKKLINKLISDYKQASFNSNWNEFEMLFEKVHYFFYEKLNAKFPDLSANERKMCAFLKLNMTSKDISQITFQSEDALKKARLRLRQKLGIDRETNLTSFLQNI